MSVFTSTGLYILGTLVASYLFIIISPHWLICGIRPLGVALKGAYSHNVFGFLSCIACIYRLVHGHFLWWKSILFALISKHLTGLVLRWSSPLKCYYAVELLVVDYVYQSGDLETLDSDRPHRPINFTQLKLGNQRKTFPSFLNFYKHIVQRKSVAYIDKVSYPFKIIQLLTIQYKRYISLAYLAVYSAFNSVLEPVRSDGAAAYIFIPSINIYEFKKNIEQMAKLKNSGTEICNALSSPWPPPRLHLPRVVRYPRKKGWRGRLTDRCGKFPRCGIMRDGI